MQIIDWLNNHFAAEGEREVMNYALISFHYLLATIENYAGEER